jgi:dCMP deaminase
MFNKFDISYMKMAHIWAKNSHCRRKQVGALVVKNNIIISDGFNGTPSGTDNSCEDSDGETKWNVIHAEANAICKLARSSNSAEGATLYVTLSPCRECCKLILMSGITRVVYDIDHSDQSGLELLRHCKVRVEQLKLSDLP